MKTLLVGLIILPFISIAQTFEIIGKIYDGFGQPIPNATVVISKKDYAISNFDGIYKISKLKQGNYTLTISSLGYKTRTKTIDLNTNLTLNFTLKDDVEQLDGITVTSKKKSTLQKEKPLSISSFDIKDIVSQTSIIADEIDKLPGVRIRRSGSLGDNSTISINGLSGTAVRVYIDGIPLEFLYPRMDLANIPVTYIERVDVYKGVLPVDIGTDAMGGGINLITDKSRKNNIGSTYSYGSFNTHLGSLSLTLSDKKQNFLNIVSGINYSDNNYEMLADVVIKDPKVNGGFIELEDQKIRRFHDLYRMQFSNTSIGTTNKTWADYVELSVNYLNIFKEYQNGLRIMNRAFGEARGNAENSSFILNYQKALLNKKFQIRSISNYSKEFTKYIDTSRVSYNWLGEALTFNDRPGEFNNGTATLANTTTKSYINRSSLGYSITDTQKMLLSNIIAHQNREVKDFDVQNPDDFVNLPEQKVTKNILGLQYEGDFFKKKLKFTAAGKYYNYSLSAIEFDSKKIINTSKDFLGWNSALKYKVTDNLSFKGSFERGFLIPEIYQFAGNTTGIVSNAEIKPEHSDNYNFGFQFNESLFNNVDVTWSANGFLREQEDIIFLRIENPLKYVNDGRVNTKGVESEIKITAFNNFSISNSFSYVDKRYVGFARESVINEFLIGSPFPNTPNLFYNIQLQWKKNNILNSNINSRIYISYHHVDTFNFIPVANKDTPKKSPDNYIPKQHRLDTGISFKFLKKQLITSINIINITNERLFDNYSIPRPGRSINFKLIYKSTKI